MSDTDQRRETGERTDADGHTRRRLLYGVAAGAALLAGCSGGGGDGDDGGDGGGATTAKPTPTDGGDSGGGDTGTDPGETDAAPETTTGGSVVSAFGFRRDTLQMQFRSTDGVERVRVVVEEETVAEIPVESTSLSHQLSEDAYERLVVAGAATVIVDGPDGELDRLEPELRQRIEATGLQRQAPGFRLTVENSGTFPVAVGSVTITRPDGSTATVTQDSPAREREYWRIGGNGGSRDIYIDVPLATSSQVSERSCGGEFDVEFTVSAYQRSAPSDDATARLSVGGTATEEDGHYSCRQADVVFFSTND